MIIMKIGSWKTLKDSKHFSSSRGIWDLKTNIIKNENQIQNQNINHFQNSEKQSEKQKENQNINYFQNNQKQREKQNDKEIISEIT